MVFLLFLSAISTDNREGWVAWAARQGEVGWSGRWQKTPFETPHEQPWCLHSGQ